MNLKNMMRSWQGASQVTAAMVASNVVLVGVVLLLAVKMVSMHERVVLLPPHVEKRATVAWNTADSEYLKAYGMYFAQLIGNVTPKSAPVIAETLSAQVAPAIYPAIRKQILAIAQDPAFNTAGGAVRFDPTEIQYEAQTNKVFVLGDTSTTNASGRVDKANTVVELEIQMVDGRPLVTGAWNYAGNEPHTQDWHDHKGAAAAAAASAAEQG